MKLFLITTVFIGLISTNLLAQSTTELNCQFKNAVLPGIFSVAFKNLESSSQADLAEIYSDYEGEPTAFSFDGNEELEWFWYLLLSGDNGYEFDQKGNFVLYLDSDGCDVGVLKLYKNSKYRAGYTKIEHHCSGDVPDTYGILSCK